MKNQETGEFELVLGNRQLLSGFFIVVILFGVFFTMGYIVGRNSTPAQRIAAAEAPVSQPPAAVQAEAPRPQPVSAAAQPPAGASPAGTAPVQPATDQQVQPQPAAAGQPQPPAAAPAQPAAAAPAKPVEAAKDLPNGVIEPAPGEIYLQVTAQKPRDAEVVRDTLRDKGFRAVLGAMPVESRTCAGCVRVLVGPFADTAALGQAKAGLENAGFHPIVRK